MTKVNKNAKAAPTTQAKAPAKPAKPAAPAKPVKGAKPAPAKPTGDQRSTPAPSLAQMPRRMDFARLQVPMAQDNTRVVRPLPTFDANQARSNSFATGFQRQFANLPAPRQHYISQAPAGAMERARRNEAQRKAQANINKIAQLDPFAARVNGMYNFGSDRNPDWQKVGGSPLEIVATNAGVGGKVVGLYLTGKHVKHAIEHPSVVTVGEATIGVLGTVGGFKHAHGVTGQILHRSHQAHEVMQLNETAGPLRYVPKK